MLWNSFKSRFVKNDKKPGLKPESVGLTDIGLKRSHNEDTIFLSDDTGLYLVADGMGGHAHGEVASAMAAETLSARYLPSDREPPSLLLREAIQEANSRIYWHSKEKVRSMEGTETLVTGIGTMGTTIVALALSGENVSIGNVGDSRAYRVRNRRLQLLTQDHSLAALQPSAGNTSVPAVRSRLKHILTRALGMEAKVEVDLYEERVERDDLFLLCSDGLTNMVSDERIEAILSSPSSIRWACETLIKEANQNGGRDNISCVLVRPR